MKRMPLAMLLILLLLLSACAAPAEPLPEEAPAAPQETEPTEHTGGDAEAQEETPDPPEEEPAPSGETYTIDLSGREDLLFSCTVWTDEEGEADAELSVTDDVRTSLGQIFDGTVVEAGEMPANIPCIFLTAGSLRILVDEYGLVSVMDDSFEGCFSLPFERFSSLRALLPENATAFIHT